MYHIQDMGDDEQETLDEFRKFGIELKKEDMIELLKELMKKYSYKEYSHGDCPKRMWQSNRRSMNCGFEEDD